MINGTLYTVTGLGVVAALDPGTGQVRWTYDPKGYELGRGPNLGFVQRGLGYWTDGQAERLFVGTADSYLRSIDATTGRPDPAFGVGGKIDLIAGIRDAKRGDNISPRGRPLVAGSIVLVGFSITDRTQTKRMPPGDVQAFDVRSGKRLWVFHTVPRKGEFGHDTWRDGSADYAGNANVWAGMTYDPVLNYVYLATSTVTNDFYGGHRPGDNLFGESIVCLDAKNGKRVWHFQAVHHGLWDYDFAAHPILGDVTVEGVRVPAVMQVSKQAFVYAFNRKTGKPLWPIVERPVPSSSVPGEWASPTQPFPTKPPAYDLQGAIEENVVDFTPEIRQRALAQLRQLDHGPIFTPPSTKGTVLLPSMWGGTNWMGAAFDPTSGVLYVPSKMNADLMTLLKGAPDQTDFSYVVRTGGPLARHLTLDGLPLFKPPYSRVTAIDMNKGDHLWMTPLGGGPRNHPLLKDLDLPPLGEVIASAPAPGVLVTPSLLFVSKVRGLVFSRGGLSAPEPADGESTAPENTLLYVLDKATGRLLRTVQVDGSANSAPPMTYAYGGRQYIVVASGTGPSAELMALSTPPPR